MMLAERRSSRDDAVIIVVSGLYDRQSVSQGGHHAPARIAASDLVAIELTADPIINFNER